MFQQSRNKAHNTVISGSEGQPNRLRADEQPVGKTTPKSRVKGRKVKRSGRR